MKTLIIWTDAYRNDYINENLSPFLYSLKGQSLYGKLDDIFGFRSIAPSFLTGMYPNKHGQFMSYRLKKNSSLKRFYLVSKISEAKLFKKMNMNKISNLGFNFYRYCVEKKTSFAELSNIPPKFFKFFDFSMDNYYCFPNIMDSKSLFDIMREKKYSFLVYDKPLTVDETMVAKIDVLTHGDDFSRLKKVKAIIDKMNKDLYFFHMLNLDKYGHELGPNSPKMSDKIKEEDELIENLVNFFQSKYKKSNILIWSDHGMLKMKNKLDVKKEIEDINLEVGKDYIYFLNSTIVQFWFFNEQAKKRLKERLIEIKNGRILTEKEIVDLKINFKDNRYGDLLFVAEPSNLILPNFFSGDVFKKGMHGFKPSIEEQKGFYFLLDGKHKENVNGKIVDMLPTLLKSLGIKNNIVFDGKSLGE